MTLPLKEILAAVATLMALYSYVIYIRGIIQNRTKPHAFSWLVWFLLTAIAFAAQVSKGAGPGAWVTGFTALCSLFIFGISLKRSNRDITKSDWIALLSAFVAIAIWQLTKQPVWSVILVSLIDAVAFYPTFRKSWNKPDQEVATTYLLSSIKFILAIVALETFSPTTWLYPASLVFMNGAFVIMLMIRRASVSNLIRPAAPVNFSHEEEVKEYHA